MCCWASPEYGKSARHFTTPTPRGLYPGLPNVLRLLGATASVRPVIESINAGKAQEVHAEVLRLANLFIAQSADGNGEATTPDAEELLTQVHRGGEVDADLRVVYWSDAQGLAAQLVDTIEWEMSNNTGQAQDPDKPYKLWRAATEWKADVYQILTPHRGELHGVEALNSAVQDRVAATAVQAYGMLNGITLYDKVIQVRNRSRSNPISAYDLDTKRRDRIEIYNGQMGFVPSTFQTGTRNAIT